MSQASWSLKRVTRRFKNTTDITENSSPINNILGSWKSVKTPMHSMKVFQSLNHKCQQAIPFASLIVVLPKIWSSVHASTWFDLITGNAIQLVHDSTSPWPSHMLRSIDVFSPCGPRISYLSCKWANPALGYAPQPTPSEKPKRHLFSQLITWWRLMQLEFSSRNSDYALTSWSKDQAVTLIILQHEHHDMILLQMILWVMSIMALSTHGMISLSIGCNAPWLGSLNHQLINEPVILDITWDSLSFNTTPMSMFLIDIVLA
jgi:hypothetical protein